MATKVFKGANVFMSRNLVPPELFDALHDALKLNGAQEKFEDLRAKGCPQCVLSCAKEHRVLPNQDFTCCLAMDGVNILASGFEKDEKAEIAKMVTAMGGVLVAKASSDVSFVIVKNVLAQKYKWALNNLKKPIVTTSWLLQCWKEHRVVPQDCYRVLPFSGLTICVSGIPAACLSEESYPVQVSTISSLSTLKTMEQHSQGKGIRNSQHTSSSMATASDSETNFSAQDMGPDIEQPLPNIYPAYFEAPSLPKRDNDPPADMQKDDPNFARCVADDSQSEDDDLYLSECRILLVGFEASELRKLVDMVRRGGGSREIKEVRSVAAFGVIYVVKTAWLEECTFKKKEVPVLKSHIAYDLLLPKDPVIFNKATATSMNCTKQAKSSASQPMDDNILGNKHSQCEVMIGFEEEAKPKVQSGVSNGKHMKSATVFKGKLFRFSSSFPEEQRPEIVLWVHEGGGEVIVDQNINNAHFTVERHGVPQLTHTFGSTYVTTHWIHSCLQDGCLLDVSSHILYSPLTCQIPLPGFEGYRLCVSRYDMRERQLLRNLCYVLGVKFVEKLTKKVTHLLCKFADGDKYEAACRWGIHVVTAEWIYECAMKNKVVDLKGFYPKELTSQDREAGLYFVSQYPTQSVRMTSGDDPQCPTQLQDQSNMQNVASTRCMARDEDNNSSSGSKRARLLGNDSIKHPLSFVSAADNSVNRKNPTENNVTENTREPSVVPDVAAAIEDLLEQTSKFLSSNSTMLGQRHAHGQSDPGPSKHWMNRLEKRDDSPSADPAARGFYDGFSETQTDSQVVGYEEDLSGRQMIIDRVRTRSSMA
ncbi:UNVERIFIED_CONTAM: hypothetical protein Sradi_1566500 [Sesamum radiatum]|uniref:BRCT domain-containing protein n=1 Tax=Sesamum radiatum TaxID=300843 RepID=A0AAW2U9T1_SESRA